jgi:hypothetical protein
MLTYKIYIKNKYLEDKNTELWWAGKEILRGKQLKDFIGKNEKTKIVI